MIDLTSIAFSASPARTHDVIQDDDEDGDVPIP